MKERKVCNISTEEPEKSSKAHESLNVEYKGDELIIGYNAIVNPELLGFKVTVYAYVGLESQAENDLKTFENYISNFPEVRECHMLVGEVDFLLKIVAKDWDDFQSFLTKNLTQAPKVSNVKTSLNIRSVKKLPGIPFETMI